MIDGDRAAEKTAILVTGMHGSGLSILAECLSFMGFALPGDRRPAGGEASNTAAPPGEIVRLNDRILADLRSAWDRPIMFFMPGKPPLEVAAAVDAIIARRYLADAAAAVRSSYGEARRVVLDDPRVSLFPGLWDCAVRELGFTARRVLVVRNPLEVSALLQERNQLGQPRANQLWLRYNLAALAPLEHARPEFVVHFDALLAQKWRLVANLANKMGLWKGHFVSGPERVDRFLDEARRSHTVTAERFFRSPLLPAVLKDTYRLLLNWDAQDPAERVLASGKLAARFQEHVLLTGAMVALPAPAAARTTAGPLPAVTTNGAAAPRRVIIHYHFFKNAGTSIDTILKWNFGERWTSQEYNGPAGSNIDTVAALLRDRPDLMALSSHTLELPPPELPNVEVFPILFIRHPLDRLKSAYIFERTQQADTVGTRLARQHDFAGYLRGRLDIRGDRTCRNFHAHRLAMADSGPGTELQRALRVFAKLPFVGSVEAFDASIDELERLLKPHFPDFEPFVVRENVSRPGRAIEARVAELKSELGAELFDRVMAANADDLELYRRSLARYGRSGD